MTTVTAVKRALEECVTDAKLGAGARYAISQLLPRPDALTAIANRLSDRGEAGNAASAKNLKELETLAYELAASDHVAFSAVEWAIDQLTPPELASAPVMGLEVKADPTLPSDAFYIQQVGRVDRAAIAKRALAGQEIDVSELRYLTRADCPTPLGEVCQQGQRCCQYHPREGGR